MELIIAPRNTGEPARDYAYRVLSENIAKLKLYPGCPLNDQEVAVRLGISRTPRCGKQSTRSRMSQISLRSIRREE